MATILSSLRWATAALALCSAPAANAASCWAPAAISAARISEFDIMLMTTTLRCRSTHNEIQANYERFAKAHRSTLDDAHGKLRAHFGVTAKTRNGANGYDRFLISLANFYGAGETTKATCSRFAALAAALGEIADSLDALQSVIFAVVRDPRIDGARCRSHAEATPAPKP